jgi:hypothetical protein
MPQAIGLICQMCEKDADIVCKRDADVECLICGAYLCGGHVAQHLKFEHCVSLSLEYCSKPAVPKRHSARMAG